MMRADTSTAAKAKLAQRLVYRHEYVLERDRSRDEVLLDHVLHQRVEARAIGLYAAGVGVAPEHLVELADVLVQPRQHQRMTALEPRQRQILGVDEALVES